MNRKKVLIPIVILTIVILILVFKLNISYRYNSLSIDEVEWNNIINNKNESNTIRLNSIEFDGYSLIINERTSTIYYSLINSSSTKYNPSIRYTTNEKDANIAFFTDEITDEKIINDHEFKLMIYTKNEYKEYSLVCTDLPVLNISYKSNNKKNTPVRIYLFDNLTNTPRKVIISDGRLKEIDEGYILNLDMLTPGKNVRENSISIFNMKPKSNYILNKESEITFNLSKNKEQNSNSHKLLLFINNEYKGIYYLR